MSMRRALLALLLLSVAKQPLSFANEEDGAIVGWRGDGSGRYPGATPPTTWGRVSKAVQGLRTKASRPGDADRGDPMADGVIREWLVLSPAPTGGRLDQD